MAEDAAERVRNPVLPAFTLRVEGDAVMPVGRPEAVMSTLPENPFWPAMLT